MIKDELKCCRATHLKCTAGHMHDADSGSPCDVIYQIANNKG